MYSKILNRIHRRITVTSRLKKEKYLWYVVPQFIFGQPSYHQGDYIANLVDKLPKNGFHVKFISPNTLYLSWVKSKFNDTVFLRAFGIQYFNTTIHSEICTWYSV